jgi:hypothetical protein
MSEKSNADKLVYMANQIAAFFVTQPGETAPLRIAEHIAAFWTPAMRREITRWLDDGGAGLKPAAEEAVRLLKTQSDGSVERALHAAGQPAPGHEQGSDAG